MGRKCYQLRKREWNKGLVDPLGKPGGNQSPKDQNTQMSLVASSLPGTGAKYLPELFGSLREPYAKTPFLRFSQYYNFHPNGGMEEAQLGLKSVEML
ncbi:hypothetical protein OUZ56_003095 [Daphnia magna]|uniref:Uncharacterized protein n=1 Tax=Daphnia magna TaxID=35525 RepID=A0ABR0A867_9CRUS|nr:hypothetical protein OUZ56_003095 [Daphnia magna]